MNRQVSVMKEAVETLEVAAYPMETYQLTQEDETLAAVHCLNAIRARKRPHHAGVHDAQRRAARLADQVARYEVSVPGVCQGASDDASRTRSADPSVSRRGEARSHSCPALGRTCGDVPFGGDSQPCSTKRNTSPSRDADVRRRQSRRLWTVPTSFWSENRHAGTRVAPASDASEVHSHCRHQERFPQSSTILRKLSSMMRRTNPEKHKQKRQFDSLFHVASSETGGGHLDSFTSATSWGTSSDFGDEPVLANKGDVHSERRKSSLMCALGKGFSGFKAAVKKQRASPSAEVRLA